MRTGSWADFADVLYLDNPVGNGFSYGDSYLTTIEDTALEFIKFYDAFIQMYPEYAGDKGRGIYLAGESFGAKYVATFGKYLDDHFNNLPAPSNVKGIIMGDPLISPPI